MTVAKWLVISQARRVKRGRQASLAKAARKKIEAQHIELYVSKIF